MADLALQTALAPRRQGIRVRVARMIALGRTRRALSGLDAHLLRDIGLSPDVAASEAGRPVWDVPPGWRL